MIERLDHLVLTVKDLEATCDFYSRVLGMEVVTFHGGRLSPKAFLPTPSSADLCFITSVPLQTVMEHLSTYGVEIIEGPVQRTGAVGPIQSIHMRDPDQNLIEVSTYVD